MKHRLIVLCYGLLGFLMAPVAAFADDDTPKPDVRLQGYSGKGVAPIEGANVLTWALLILLTLICIGVLFKNARRSHLD